ncbi:hypothetical protein AC578_225 [Pseudocercospora eumusae]|uniref:Uncharacterized protein n=1 Tax=Pseudocercospora eumusae TaxID=321146 RepID=A0A139HIM6_9PEZI|nr:hypothetical protein AC578_225 [Pseudocercospora eumusae]
MLFPRMLPPAQAWLQNSASLTSQTAVDPEMRIKASTLLGFREAASKFFRAICKIPHRIAEAVKQAAHTAWNAILAAILYVAKLAFKGLIILTTLIIVIYLTRKSWRGLLKWMRLREERRVDEAAQRRFEQRARELEEQRRENERRQEQERERRAREQEQERERKAREQEQERERKAREQEQERERKAREQEQERERKAREQKQERERSAREQERRKAEEARRFEQEARRQAAAAGLQRKEDLRRYEQWRLTCDSIFRLPENCITEFPEPYHWDCHHDRCKQSSRYLRACEHSIRRLCAATGNLRETLGKERHRWHPNRGKNDGAIFHMSADEQLRKKALELSQILQRLVEEA